MITILYVEDLTAAVRFYDAVFGWAKVVEAPTYVEYVVEASASLALMNRDSARHFLGVRADDIPTGRDPRAEIYLRVADLDASIARLHAAGATPTSPRALRDWGDEAAYFLDLDGTVIAVAIPICDSDL